MSKKFVARCHKYDCKIKKLHMPKISNERNTLRESIEIGKQMMKNNKTHVYINWEEGEIGF